VVAKGDYRCAETLIDPEIVVTKGCELFLFLVGPKTRTGVPVPDGVDFGFVLAAKLGGKREVLLLQAGTVGDEANGFKCASVKNRADAQPCDVASKGFNVNIVDSGVVELIEYQNLQEDVGNLGVVGKLSPEQAECFLSQLILLIECVTFCSYEFNSGGRKQRGFHNGDKRRRTFLDCQKAMPRILRYNFQP
jgi:hypothetical protein